MVTRGMMSVATRMLQTIYASDTVMAVNWPGAVVFRVLRR